MTPEKILELLPKKFVCIRDDKKYCYDCPDKDVCASSHERNQAIYDCANALSGKVEEVKSKCSWDYDEFTMSYDTKCGNKQIFIDADIQANEYKFCPYCGGEIVEAQQRKANRETA